VGGVISYLAIINGILAAFNTLPAFPLDGGRILRAILWGWKGNLRWATRIASRIGSGFGVVLVVLGALQFIQGNLIGGIWWCLIGIFLQNAARASYQQVLTRQIFEGEKVRRLMRLNPITVPPSISISQLVEKYFYPHQFKTFPVVENRDLLGYVSIEQVKEIPHREWDRHTVGELVQKSSPENTIPPETDVIKALAIMNRTRNSRLMVTEGGRLVGIVSLKDLLKLLSLKMDLENYGK
jgi:CBS domain-containing protein